MAHRTRWFVVALNALAASVFAGETSAPVRFDRDIRSLLSENCFKCHGPDEQTRQAELRLDLHDAAVQSSESSGAIVPGHPEKSLVWARINATDPEERMPPVDSGKNLTPAQRELIRRWIEEGASWEEHWAFVPPRPVTPPRVQQEQWVRNGIDRFVAARLEAEGMKPSPETDKARLIRRVTFDLTGLPPTPEELRAFLTDTRPDAYERVVDRLLHSTAYGERMAMQWLDAARYADTHGYIFDSERSMWRWRDWVIQAFNDNMPFDQFTVEQLAGDLLPRPTLAQQIASGFNRNHVINGEFGAIDEEYLVENIADRVNTTATVWLGLTAQCARCHDHKYDPLTQREFYELYAFFDQTGEKGLDGFFDNAGPVIRAPLPEQTAQLAGLSQKLRGAEQSYQEVRGLVAELLPAWEAHVRRPIEDVRDGLLHYWPCDEDLMDAAGSGIKGNPDDIIPPPRGGGVIGKSVVSIGLGPLKFLGAGKIDERTPFSLGIWVTMAKTEGRRSLLTRMVDGITLGRGYAFQVHDGRLSLALVHEYPGNYLEVESDVAVEPDQWQHCVATYDGSGRAAGVRLYLNGRPLPLHVVSDTLSGSIDLGPHEPLLVADGTPNAVIRGQVDEVRMYTRALSESEVKRLPGVTLDSLMAIEPAQRTAEAQRRILEAFLAEGAPAEWNRRYLAIQRLQQQRNDVERTVPTVMVMQEQEKAPEAHILMGGAYDRKGEEVSPGTPRFLPPFRNEWPKNRLGLAQWLMSPDHPLTARVTVNRFWQMYFGTGLVKTADDFGAQGERPSHPELLDWLSLEFINSGWDVRALQRLIVTSATYRQSSQALPEQLHRDPENRLLARGPRFRMPAEFIRDQALATCGLLVRKVGGPSVKPYQPEGLWQEGAFDPTGNKWSAQYYEQDHGAPLFRRSMYTFWKRTAPPPSMLVFDAPERERCVVTRSRTNTPLQALVLMNDPTYVEASRHLAERMLKETDESNEQRIRYGFELVTCRAPASNEVAPLLELLERQQQRFAADPQAARELLEVGESSRDESLSPVELAAFTTVASVLYNLDETLTKN